MNSGWHERHPMPRGATVEERFAWHMAHQNACACRPIPASLLKQLGAPRGKKKR